MDKITILWADDEIDLLKPQILFLNNKGYEVDSVTNGYDVLDKLEENTYDVIFLDESMPGLTGLETLSKIRASNSTIPIVMITKNEAENIMEEAIGAQITDYLIKPVNPNQILLTLKKIIDKKSLVQEKTSSNYQQEFQKLFMEMNGKLDFEEWAEIYKKLIYWELELEKSNSSDMKEIFSMQKQEANKEFCKMVEKNYADWVNQTQEAPVLSHNLMQREVFPKMEDNVPTFFILLDNLRFDQWKMIQPIFEEHFKVVSEKSFYSILPTTTQYSRNAIFSGLMPADIEKQHKEYWRNDAEEGGKNMFEGELFQAQIDRTFRKDIKADYVKITNHHNGKLLSDNIHNYLNNDITSIVYNFVDMLSHARTEMEVLKELASNEAAYRSLTVSWFKHSPLWTALKRISDKKVNLFIASDHGSIRVQEPTKVVGDRDTTTNLRYKHGRTLDYKGKDVLAFRNPKEAKLPTPHISSSFIFAKEDKFFVYPNRYNHFVNYYKNTFQHGGISLEEVIIPIVHLTTK